MSLRRIMTMVLCVAGLGAAAPATAAEIDHVIVLVADLDKAGDDLAARTGMRTVFGGAHTDGGTANRLASLGPHLYLELLGPAEGAGRSGEAGSLAALTSPEPAGFALRTTDAEAEAARLRGAGLRTSPVRAGGRVTPSGHRLNWKVFQVRAPEFCGFVPFFIEWSADTRHPATTSPAGGSLERLRVVHPKADELNSLYATLGAPIVAEAGPAPMLDLTLKGPRGSARHAAAPRCDR